MLGIALALAAAVSWGCADFLGGLESRRADAWIVAFGMEFAGLVPLAVLLIVQSPHTPGRGAVLAGVLAGAGGGIAIACLYRALALGVMSIAAPISATGAALPVIYGIASGDRPGTIQVVGLVLAVVGIILASIEPAEHEALAPWRTGVTLALVAALGIGLFLIGADRASDDGALWATTITRMSAVPAIGVVLLIAKPSFAGVRARWRAIALIGVLDATATTLYAFATTHGLLSLVSVLGALYPVGTVFLAAGVLKERIERVQGIGVACALAGVAAIAAGQ